MTIEMHPNNSNQSRESSAEEGQGAAPKRRLFGAYRNARPRLEAYAMAVREAWVQRNSLVNRLLGRSREAAQSEPAATKLPQQASNDN